MDKNEIRIMMKSLRNQISKSKRKEYDYNIRTKLIDLKEYSECHMFFSYVSFGSEVDTIAIINNALDSNKSVYLPRVEGTYMNFYEIHNMDGLIRSKFGILEPDGSSHKKHVKSVSFEETAELMDKKKLMLFPGLAFDKQGNRIGYGAGYYDKYLGNHEDEEFIKVALAYDFQIIDHIKTNQYDISADVIITPKNIYICNEY